MHFYESNTPRLLQVTTVPLMLEAFLLNHSDYFREKGWVVDGAALDIGLSSKCLAHFDQCHGISFSRNPLRNNVLKICLQIRSLVASRRYDIVHVHSPIAAFLVRLALRQRKGSRPAVIYTAHGFHFHDHASGFAPSAYKLFEKLAAPWTDYLVVINDQDYTSASQYFKIPRTSIRLFPGIGIDLSLYSRDRVSAEAIFNIRRALSLAEKDELLVTVGELNPGKRHQDAIACLERLNRPDVHLAIVGIGPMEGALRRLVKSFALEKRVHFLGYRSDIPAILCSSTALLFPSEREGLSRAVMEALALEVPVVGSHARGVLDLIDHDCGLVFPTGDIEAFSVQVKELLDNPGLRNALSLNGKKRVSQYDLASVLDLYEKLYYEALSRQGGECSGFPTPIFSKTFNQHHD